MKANLLLTLAAITGIVLLFTFLPSTRAATAPPQPAASSSWTTGLVWPEDVGQEGHGDFPAQAAPHVIDLSCTGRYDPDRWMVILSYQSLTIHAGATVVFKNHPSRAPVVIRSVEPIVIDGELRLDGAGGSTGGIHPYHAEPGPGGFRGGIAPVPGVAAQMDSDGFGVGGGYQDPGVSGNHGGGSHSSFGGVSGGGTHPGPLYGNASAWPLLGGSGGTAGANGQWAGGGAGGGALLLGSDSSITLGGKITANGGVGGWIPFGTAAHGSGGTIRLAAPTVGWSGTGNKLEAAAPGTSGLGLGWIRVESSTPVIPAAIPSYPVAAEVTTLSDFLPTQEPRITLAKWYDDAAGIWRDIAQDPRGSIDFAQEPDVRVPSAGYLLVRLMGQGVPIGAPLQVRVTNARGRAVLYEDSRMGTNPGSTLGTSWTEVRVDLSEGVSAIQVRTILE